LKWIRSKGAQDKIEFKRLQNKSIRMVSEEKNKSWGKTCLTAEGYLGGKRRTEAWRILQNLKKNENGRQCFNPILTGKWETYFKELLTENIACYLGDQEVEVEDMNKIRTEEINLDLELVKITIKSLKFNTSCGVGGVLAELLKSGTEKLFEFLRRIFERCLNGDKIPNDWKIGHI
jgi:hypothetical protein